jgi:hypothetical protein
MLKRLIDIRTFVEHQDSSPPPADECLMFADLVWYFLRSSDALVRSMTESLLFVESGTSPLLDTACRASLKFREPFTQPPEISGHLDPNSVAHEPKQNWIRVEAEYAQPIDWYFRSEEYVKVTRNGGPFWTAFLGKVRGTDDQMRSLYQLYISEMARTQYRKDWSFISNRLVVSPLPTHSLTKLALASSFSSLALTVAPLSKLGIQCRYGSLSTPTGLRDLR